MHFNVARRRRSHPAVADQKNVFRSIIQLVKKERTSCILKLLQVVDPAAAGQQARFRTVLHLVKQWVAWHFWAIVPAPNVRATSGDTRCALTHYKLAGNASAAPPTGKCGFALCPVLQLVKQRVSWISISLGGVYLALQRRVNEYRLRGVRDRGGGQARRSQRYGQRQRRPRAQLRSPTRGADATVAGAATAPVEVWNF